jgi:hypothetical protein
MKNHKGSSSCCRHAGRWLVGIIFIALGIIFLLKSFGMIHISIWEGFKTFWPVGLILIGIALILKMRWLGFAFFIIIIVAGSLFIAERINLSENMETREVIQDITLESEIKNADIEISYSAGEFSIEAGKSDTLIKNMVKTADLKNPIMEYKKTETEADIKIKRAPGTRLWNSKEDSWNIELSPKIINSIKLDYGASNAEIDLRNLKIEQLEINTGASNTEITFGKYPTKTSIETGASSVVLKFPKDIGVIIKIKNGLAIKNFNRLKKEEGNYISDNYDLKKQNIEVEIEAGVSEITTEFY